MALGINRISMATITFSSVVVWMGFMTWRIMFNNYAVEVFDASPTDVGIIQAAREIPGLLAFGVGALALWFAESRIAAFSIVVIGLGLIFCGWAPSITALGLGTVVMSFGFHYFEPTNSSQLLLLSRSHELGRAQGRLQSFEAMAGLLGAGLVLVITFVLDYRSTFYIVGGIIVAVGLYLALALPSNRADADHRKVRIRRRYWLYYTLSFLRGCRRHIFTTFAIFLMVRNFGMSITAVSTLLLVNSAVTIFTNRGMGHLSDRWGERAVLAGTSAVLVSIFACYALVDYLPLLIVIFVCDLALFGSSIALRSYLRKISTDEDLTGCLSFGTTANHITAVIVPVLGGIAWDAIGYQATFLVGAFIVLLDMLFALKVPSRAELASLKPASASAASIPGSK